MNKIEIEDLLKYKAPENIVASPDGSAAAFQCVYPDGDKNEYRRDIYLIRGGKVSQLTSTADSAIVCWDDDTHLIIERRERVEPDEKDKAPEGFTELYRMDINGGEPMRFAEFNFGLQELRKIRDGLYVAVGEINAEEPDAYKLTRKEASEKAEERKKEHEEDYVVLDEVPYWFNGAGVTNKKRSALFTIKTDPLTIRRVTKPDFNVGDVAYDGSKVYYEGLNHGRSLKRYSHIYCFDAETGESETLYDRNDRGFYGLCVVGKTLLAESILVKDDLETVTPTFCRVEKGKVTEIVKPDITIGSSVLFDTMSESGAASRTVGDRLYTVATVKDRNVIYSFDKDMNGTVIFDKPGIIMQLDTDGKTIWFTHQDSRSLGEVYSIGTDGKGLKKLTDLNKGALEGKYVATPHRIDWKSHGEDLTGWVLLPESFDKNKKYPAVLDIHGGPRCSYGEVFFHEMQVWAAKGFVVMFTNIHGSDGRGDEFADLKRKYGYIDYEELMDFVDVVLKKYRNVDEKRLCVTGGSYGGFMTNWIVGHTDRFCAAASQRSISNWVTMTFISDIGLNFGLSPCGADGLFGDENTAKFWEHSPLKFAKGVKTPTLFIHSEEDYRCPLPEGMQMMQAICSQGVETRMVVFKGENHELSREGKPLHRIRRLKEITDWFVSHTEKKPARKASKKKASKTNDKRSR